MCDTRPWLDLETAERKEDLPSVNQEVADQIGGEYRVVEIQEDPHRDMENYYDFWDDYDDDL